MMTVRDFVARLRGKARLMRGKPLLPYYDFTAQGLPASDGPGLVSASSSELGRMTFGHTGRIVHKWTHYPDVYERHLAQYRGTSVRMLEIGVFKGGSLEVWREYLGADATIYGIDINPDCAARVTAPNHVRIGSQADPGFLRAVVEEMGGVDVVLDDGSHIAEHQQASLRVLFPLLTDGGLYMMEDLHTSYWPGPFQGGLRRSGTGVEITKDLIDDMHGWYHPGRACWASERDVAAVHAYDSITVVEKRRHAAPQHIMVGTEQEQA